MSEWKEYKLGEVAKFSYGRMPKKELLNNGQFPTFSGYKYQYTYPEYNCEKGDLIIVARGVGGTGDVKIIREKSYLTNLSIKVDFKKRTIFNDFFYYFFKQETLRYLDSGSAQSQITIQDLERESFILPDFETQKSIASILSSLDDKIDLLHRQNATLEKMAETLFRQWFVEEAKEDWEEKIITELFEVRDGTHDSPKQKEYGKKLITSRHLNNNSIDFSTAYYISEEDYYEINRRSRVDTNDILFSMIGTIGLIYFEQSEEINYAIKNIGLFKTSQNLDWSFYTLLWLKSNFGKEFIHENKSGSTQEYIALGSLRSIVFNIPPQDFLKEFNSIVKPYFEKVKSNQTQIRTLTALRDTLLPKLMSGEVRVEM